ncbi:C-type lectin domain family 2 member D-like [Leptodactylus fuscus]|uniref:C-type lectin domain family 2 member D-like n=1 Tax=Leptodactylus fuscus TaxID=238119 RepID=UPI003F4E547F
MSPMPDLSPLVVSVQMEKPPDDSLSGPYSPLLADKRRESSQQRGAPDTSTAPPVTPSELSRGTEGQCRLPFVNIEHQRRLLLIAAAIFFVGAFLGYISSHAIASRCWFCHPESSACPNKWMRSDRKCFFISRETKNWNASLEYCRSEGGTLLTLDHETQREIQTLHDLAGDYWVGLAKETDSGEWRQLDGSVWTRPIEFDDFKRKCSFMDSGKFVALDCLTPRRWICVKSLKWDQ